MYTYLYKAHQKQKTTYGFQDAFDKESLKSILQLKNLKLISAKPIREIREPVSIKQLIDFSDQMNLMLSSGISAREALEMFTQYAQESFRNILLHILRDVKDGYLFSKAFAKYNCFPALVVETLAMGEQTQNLALSFSYIKEYYETDSTISKKVKGIVTYPAAVIVLLLLVSIFMSIFILPQFQSLYQQFDSKMPMITTVYIRVGKFFISSWLMLLIMAGAMVIGWRKYSSQMLNKKNIHRFMLDAPMVSTVYRKILVARFSNVLSLYLNSGVQIQNAIMASAKMLQNDSLFEEFAMATEALVAGKRFYEVIDNIVIFPPFFKQVIFTGETSGNLEHALTKLSVNINRDAMEHVTKLSNVLKPAMLALMVVFLLPTIGAILLPVYNLTKAIKA